MRIRTRYVAIGAAAVGIAVGVGVSAVVRAVRRRRKRVLNRAMRRVMTDILQMRGEDFVPGGEVGKSVFRNRIDQLDDKQLAALFALVEVGYFIKASGIDPLHPSKEQVKDAIEKFALEERRAPETRDGLLAELDTSDAFAALTAAFRVLAW
ncbi:MAG: hypothetical protein IKF14_01190 [Atopobiaceae bacterium]|nr:hypothetical protein [Atopobiaceae bacterium]